MGSGGAFSDRGSVTPGILGMSDPGIEIWRLLCGGAATAVQARAAKANLERDISVL